MQLLIEIYIKNSSRFLPSSFFLSLILCMCTVEIRNYDLFGCVYTISLLEDLFARFFSKGKQESEKFLSFVEILIFAFTKRQKSVLNGLENLIQGKKKRKKKSDILRNEWKLLWLRN